jgi:pimeloyl-ACP methyl ester carboxylesterase
LDFAGAADPRRLRRSGVDVPAELPGYLDHDGDQLYHVLHPAAGRRAGGIVLAPTMVPERDSFYFLWVAWARVLAARGWDVFRFDYRGMGESTGRFQDTSFSTWLNDVELGLQFLRRRVGPQPVILHGIRLGALLAATLFNQGEGDALLMWSPVAGRDLLMEGLRLRLLMDFTNNRGGPRKSRDDYIAELMAGRVVEVQGYLWSKRLWEEAEQFPLRLPCDGSQRPWLHVRLERKPPPDAGPSVHAPIPIAPFAIGGDPMDPRLKAPFEPSLAWLERSVVNEKPTP